jgi:hypothetical protein
MHNDNDKSHPYKMFLYTDKAIIETKFLPSIDIKGKYIPVRSHEGP